MIRTTILTIPFEAVGNSIARTPARRQYLAARRLACSGPDADLLVIDIADFCRGISHLFKPWRMEQTGNVVPRSIPDRWEFAARAPLASNQQGF